MKNLMKYSVVIGAVVVFLAASSGVLHAEKYIFNNIISASIKEGGGLNKVMNNIVETLEEVTGYEFEYVETPFDQHESSDEIAYELLKKDEAHMVWLSSRGYAANPEKWKDLFRPAFTMQFNAKHYNDYCVYVREDSGINSVEELRGKVWGAFDTVIMRTILHEHGIDEPLDKFFSDVKYISDSPVTKLVSALSDGAMDTFSANNDFMVISGGVMADSGDKEKKMVKFRDLACVEGEHNWIFGFNSSVPDEVAMTVTKTIVRAHKLKEFQKFGFMFAAIKGHFVPYQKKNMVRTFEIVELMEKYGWDKELKEHKEKITP